MVAQTDQRHMTIEEWRALLDHSPDTKYEYIDGWIYLMAGGSLDHSDIAINTLVALRTALDERCWVRNSDAATRLSPYRFTFPDVSVTCDEHDHGQIREVRSPRVIVEVLSEATEAYDRGDKFSFYQACNSVQEYVLIATRYQAVEVYRRTAQGWTAYQRYGPDDTVHLTSIDVHIPVSVFYRRTDVPRDLVGHTGEV